jgi:hypothetical protein
MKSRNKNSLPIIIFIAIIFIIGISVFIYTKHNKQTYLDINKTGNDDMLLNNFVKESGAKDSLELRKIGKTLLDTARYQQKISAEPPTPETLPSLDVLKSNYYDTETSVFCTYLVELAYSLNENVKYTEDYDSMLARSFLNYELYKIIKNFDNFEIQEIFTFDCPGDGNISYAGFILEVYYPKPVVFVVIRGTINACEWFENAKVILETPYWAKSIKVHTGFNNLYTDNDIVSIKSIRYKLNKYIFYGGASKQIKTPNNTSKIIITGHSLGGAIANLIGADMAQNFPQLRNISKIFTFAAPYTGNGEFAQLINKNGKSNYSGLFQIINKSDPVTYLFASINYQRPKYQIFSFDTGNAVTAHSMSNYTKGVKSCSRYFNLSKKENLIERLCSTSF